MLEIKLIPEDYSFFFFFFFASMIMSSVLCFFHEFLVKMTEKFFDPSNIFAGFCLLYASVKPNPEI